MTEALLRFTVFSFSGQLIFNGSATDTLAMASKCLSLIYIESQWVWRAPCLSCLLPPAVRSLVLLVNMAPCASSAVPVRTEECVITSPGSAPVPPAGWYDPIPHVYQSSASRDSFSPNLRLSCSYVKLRMNVLCYYSCFISRKCVCKMK